MIATTTTTASRRYAFQVRQNERAREQGREREREKIKHMKCLETIALEKYFIIISNVLKMLKIENT